MGGTSSPLLLSFVLVASLTVVFLVAPRFLPPKTLPSIPIPDELDDLALFRRATLSSASDNISTSNQPQQQEKIAFMFLTNSDLSFSPLWERFFLQSSSNKHKYNIYIHADPTCSVAPPNPRSVFHGRFIPNAKPTQRASPTLISAARRLMAAALLDDPHNAFFALLSQHCVPLHSFRFVHDALFRHPHRSFIEILSGDPGLWDRYVARGDEVMLPEVPFRYFRAGSQFFVLSRRHALMVIKDRVLWRKFRLPCLRDREDSCYPEEHYFPTLLEMRDPKACSHYTLTRVNWTGSVGGHPHTYGPAEVSTDLVRHLRKSNSSTYSYLFARKFSPASLPPLMDIADSVIFHD